MNDDKRICPWCYFGRAKKDICGVYCIGEFCKESDGMCKHFIDCHNCKAIREFKARAGWKHSRRTQEAEKMKTAPVKGRSALH